MEVKTNIDKSFPFSNSKSQTSLNNTSQNTVRRYSPGKNKQTPYTYTFYQSQTPNSNKAENEGSQKRQYRFVSDQIEQHRRKSYSYLPPKSAQNSGSKPGTNIFRGTQPLASSYRYQQNNGNSDKVDPQLVHSHNSLYTPGHSREVLSFNKHQKTGIEPTLVESAIISQTENFKIRNSTSSNNNSQPWQIQNSDVKRYISSQEDKCTFLQDQQLSQKEKLGLIEEECKNLYKRNFDLAQQIMQSQTVIRQHEKRERQMEESIKISRNIITSLNERLARNKKESEQMIENIKAEHTIQITACETSKQEQLKIAEAQIFQLKMKIIDQNHLLEKSAENMEIEATKRIEEISNQYQQKLIELEGTVIQLNENIINFQVDIMKLDGQNIRLAQQNERLSSDLNERVTKFQYDEDLSKYKERVIELQNTLLQLQAKNEELEDQLQKKDASIAELKINLTNAQLQIIQQKKLIKQSSKIHQDEDSLQNSRTTEIQTLKEVIVDLQSKVKSYEFKQVDWESQVLQIQQKMMELSEEYQQKLQIKQRSIAMLSQIVEIKEEEINNINIQVSDHQELFKSIQLWKEEKQDLQNEVKQLRELYSQQETTISNLMKLLEDKEQEVTSAKEEVEALNEQLEDVVQEKNQIKQYIEKLQQFQSQMKAHQPEQQHDCSKSEGEQHSPKDELSPTKSLNSDEGPSIETPHRPPPETMQEWIDQIHEHSRQVLIMKIQELYFINKSLEMKVEDINDIENNENAMIMTKFKTFEENIEKYEEQINQLYEQNAGQKQRIQQLNDQCLVYEGRLEFMDNLYRETEVSLFETGQELIRSQLQLVNYRFGHEKFDLTSEPESQFQENSNQIDQIIGQMMADDAEDENDDNYDSEAESHSSCNEVDLNTKIKFELIEEKAELKKQGDYDQEELMKQVQQQQQQLRLLLSNRGQQGNHPQQQNIIEIMQQTSENQIHYEVDQNGLGEVVMSIKVSHVSSDSDQEEESTNKEELTKQQQYPKRQNQKESQDPNKAQGQTQQNNQAKE